MQGRQCDRIQGLHRSAAICGEYDRHSGNSVEVSLWAFPGGDVHVQLEFPGSLREGIELTPSQGLELSVTLRNLLATVEPEQFPSGRTAWHRHVPASRGDEPVDGRAPPQTQLDVAGGPMARQGSGGIESGDQQGRRWCVTS